MSACPACGGAARAALVARDWNRGLGRGRFPYSRCGACGLLFLTEGVEEAETSYGREYFEMPASVEDLRARAEPERYKLDLLRRFARGGRLLEIGPATGEFADIARRAGFEVSVIERDAACCAFLEGALGLAVTRSTDPAQVLPGLGPVDAICLWQTIEHLPRCWEVLEVAATRLRPGGVLIISAPNPAALQMRVLGRYWAHLDAPRHRVLLPIEWVIERGVRAGLRPALVTTTDPGSLSWNRFGWEVSLANHGRGRLGRRALSLVGRAVARALQPLERREGWGSAYTVVLVRP